MPHKNGKKQQKLSLKMINKRTIQLTKLVVTQKSRLKSEQY